MSFVLRPYRRFPVVCPVTYERLYDTGHGTVWNLSSSGWRMSGTLSLQYGDVCSLRVVLPIHKEISVAAGIVRWVSRHDYGIETLVINGTGCAYLRHYIRQRSRAL